MAEDIIKVDLTLNPRLLVSLGVALESMIGLHRHGSAAVTDEVVNDVKNIYCLLSTGYVRGVVSAQSDDEDMENLAMQAGFTT